MPVMRGNWAEALGPGLNMRTFEFRRLPEFYRQILKVENSRKAYEDEWSMTGFGPLVEKTELAPTTLDEPLKLGGVRFIHKTYALAFLISKEMRDDALYPQILNLAGELGLSSYWTTELYGHDVLNNGFTTAKYVGRDGKALFATDHPIAGTGGVAANRPAVDTDISEAALEAAFLSFQTQINERGMPTMAQPARLIFHPSQEFIVERLLLSTGRTGTNNNDINVFANRNLQRISDPWLTDPDAWFLTGAPQDVDIRFYWREMPDTNTWDDPNADGTFHKIRQRHSTGFAEWRNTYGSPGA